MVLDLGFILLNKVGDYFCCFDYQIMCESKRKDAIEALKALIAIDFLGLIIVYIRMFVWMSVAAVSRSTHVTRCTRP